MSKTIEHTKLLVLSLMKSGDKYGYEMISELARLSDNTFAMKEGTLYPVLKSLEAEGALKSYRQQTPSGRERKYYQLTKKGSTCLAEEEARWRKYEKAVNSVVNSALAKG